MYRGESAVTDSLESICVPAAPAMNTRTDVYVETNVTCFTTTVELKDVEC